MKGTGSKISQRIFAQTQCIMYRLSFNLKFLIFFFTKWENLSYLILIFMHDIFFLIVYAI